ncbi:hypothetical protein [Nocardioides endophyticus]|uniref:MmyB family transcriptional regulator n=1 Tax=Nocardioides endophyticus TaxID=1353775 RepID=UPI0031E8F725
MDVLAINELGRALYAPIFDQPGRPTNLARFAFLDDRASRGDRIPVMPWRLGAPEQSASSQ